MKRTVHIISKYGTILFAIVLSLNSHSQILNWAHRKGGSNSDIGYSTTKDLNGNIVTSGSFSSSNVDFDPGAGVFTLSSNGDYDVFVSKLSASGQFIWAFKIGGALRDESYNVGTDANGNIFVTGYFRGSNVDFDPGAGTFLLSSNGDSGGDPGYGGDIFVAKYNAAGQFLWAINIGGPELYDSSNILDVDQNGDVYFGGYFNGNIDFDAGPGTAMRDWNTGRIFVAKYNAAGQFVWAFNFGTPGNVDANVYGLKWGPSGNIYVTGFYQGSNIDFDPGPGTSFLNSNGSFEFYVAKYTSNGQFQWAKSAGGSGQDVARSLVLDVAENVYVAGDYRSSSMDFDLSSGGGQITNSGGADIFFVKYNSAGQNIFAYGFGGTNDDYGLGVTVDNTYAYIGGAFSGSNVDFDPTASSATLNSNGGTDIFYSKYLLNGEFVCAFNIGGSGNDQCRSLVSTGLNKINATGFFQNTNIDFDPSTGTTVLSSAGSHDIYVADYAWPIPTTPNGTLAGSTICAGGNGQLTFNATAGIGPFIITYNNGTTNIVVNNVQSGVPFNVTPNPATTTTYTFVSIRDAQQCSPTTFASGTATITVNNCTTTIINDYTPVISLDPCKNLINVGDAAAFTVGDTVLLIQMKGAVIDSSNTATFGTITNYRNAGNYEFNYVKSKTGNSIELLNKIERQYNLPDGKVQLIRVPYFQNYSVDNTLSCLPWNGSIGGVLVFNVQNNLTLNANIDVSGKGFNGGLGFNSSLLTTNCFNNEFYYPATSGNLAGIKGESISIISNSKIRGKGPLAGAGGGGLDHNSGGGGAGNGGIGGFGGYQLEPCGNAPFNNRGLGGKNLAYSNIANKIFMGSGGGAGHANNPANVNFPSSGGNGGGIVIISAQNLQSNTSKIISNGSNAPECSFAVTNNCHDAMGGGGAGGSILLNVATFTGSNSIEAKGGKGADMTGGPISIGGRIGSGGGGGGGVSWLKTASLPGNVTINSVGGSNGVLTQDANNSWGATPGANGINLFNLQLPIDNILFKPNIDSVRIKDSIATCTNFDFKGLGYTNTNPIASWQWYFGDGGTANTQNTSHNYAPGTYTVKLVVTDINGCKDSVTNNVTASLLTVNAGNDSTICSGQSLTLQGSSNGGTQFQWNNVTLLNNNTILNPTATPPDGNTLFIITASNSLGCSRSDSVEVFVRAQSAFSVDAAFPVCKNDSVQLLAQGGDLYLWQPSAGIDPTIPDPFVSPQITTTYTVQITDTLCNFSQTLSTQVVVLPLPSVQATKQNDLDCIINTARLNASGATTYTWSPSATLNNPNIANPVASPTTTTLYTVTGTDASGCKNSDTISVVLNLSGKSGLFLMANAFTPNNDGLNDCFGIKLWGILEEVEFNIYNRWGELIFHTNDASKCWDGKWKGREQDPAVFVYWIRAKSICAGTVFRKGTVVLIR